MTLMPPLNGTKTHPLTDHAWGVLLTLSSKPLPRQEINPGVVNRLEREGLVEEIKLPSPYRTHKSALIRYLQITDVGRARLMLGVH